MYNTIKLNNVYIKQKIKSLCESPQFQELTPYKGADNLIKYLTEVWKIWIDLLYAAGGKTYFESIGAEMEWEWVDKNPFDEIKKYDVFYWGLDKDYWPEVIEQCNIKDASGKMIPSPKGIIKTTSTNNLTRIGTISGGYYVVDIWRAKNITYEGVNYYPIGDVLVGPSTYNSTRRQNIRYSDLQLNGSIDTPVLNTYLVGGDYVMPPVDYTLLWNDGKIWIWRPKGPTTDDGEYIALGDIATTSSNPPPTNQSAPIRCILKSSLVQITTTQKLLWNTRDSSASPAIIFGFSPYDGNTAPAGAGDNNAYNLFRLALGTPNSIALTDVYGSFYYINNQNYDINDQPGKQYGNPLSRKDNLYDGKGWKSNPAKDSKYSILAYLNLKPKMEATNVNHSDTLELINNTSFGNSNSYMVKYKGKCLEVSNNTVISKLCNMAKAAQCFRIEMTGKSRGEFRLHHISSGQYLQADGTHFQLVSEPTSTTPITTLASQSNVKTKDYTLFYLTQTTQTTTKHTKKL